MQTFMATGDHVRVIKLYSELKKGPRFVETCRKIWIVEIFE